MRLVLSVEKMHFLAYSFKSPDTYDNVMLMCQKVKYLLFVKPILKYNQSRPEPPWGPKQNLILGPRIQLKLMSH